MRKFINIINKTSRLFKIVKGAKKRREIDNVRNIELDDHNDSSNWSYS